MSPTAPDALPDPGDRLCVRLPLSVLFVLQLAGGFLAGPVLWGMHHLAYAPALLRFALPLAGLLLIWTPAGGVLGRRVAQAVAGLLRRPILAYGAAPLVGGLIFWLARCRTHFLGDGWLLGELVARRHPFHGYELLDYHLHVRLFQWFGLEGEAGAFQLYALVSVAAGMLYLAAAAWGARNLSNDDGERVLLYGLLVCAAPVQMFMGYVEGYALLLVCTLLFLLSLAMYYRRGLSVRVAGAFFGLGLIFHLDALFLAPLLLAAVLWPPARDPAPWPRRLLNAALPVIGLAALGLVILLAAGYNRRWFTYEFGDQGGPASVLVALRGVQGLLSWVHWKDVVNLALLLAPVPLALLIAARFCGETKAATKGKQRRARPRELRVFLFACLWLLALVGFVYMKLGPARDWDLFAAQAPLVAVATTLVWAQRTHGRVPAAFAGRITLVALLLGVPYFAVNAHREQSVARFANIMADQSTYAHAYAHEEIGKYYRNRGELDVALTHYEMATRISPSNPRLHVVLGELHVKRGDREAALDAFLRSLEVDSLYVVGLEVTARHLAEDERLEESLGYVRKLAGRPGERVRTALLHAEVARRAGYPREAAKAYQRALNKRPDRLDVVERMVMVLVALDGPAQVERAARAQLARGPRSRLNRSVLCLALWVPLRNDPESWNGPGARQKLEEALRIAEDLGREFGRDENLTLLRRTLAQALATLP